MAYVSVAIDETADTAESATLKDEISQVVKKTDTEIDTVYVMEDADTFTRMKEIGEDIANGKPISGFAEESLLSTVRSVGLAAALSCWFCMLVLLSFSLVVLFCSV